MNDRLVERLRAWVIQKLGGSTSDDVAEALLAVQDEATRQIQAIVRDAENVTITADYLRLDRLVIAGDVSIDGKNISLIGCKIEGDLELRPNAELQLGNNLVLGNLRDAGLPQ